MNQEQNNLNPNNFNTQGNNGIPNNQPLQNSQNLSNTFNSNVQQNINVSAPIFNNQPTVEPTLKVQPQSNLNFQQPASQSFNTVGIGKANNSNFNSKPQKKSKLVLILGIISICIITIISLVLILGTKESAKSVAKKYINEILNNNYMRAFEYVYIPDEGLVSLEDYNEYVELNSYFEKFSNKKVKNIEQISSTSEEVIFNVGLVDANGIYSTQKIKVALNDNKKWKVKEPNLYIEDWQIIIPGNYELYIDEIKVDTKYIKVQKDLKDVYELSAIANFDKKFKITGNLGNREFNLVPSVSNSEYNVTLELTDDNFVKKGYDYIKTAWNEIYAAYISKKDVSEIKKYFYSGFDIKSIEKYYTSDLNSCTNVDSSAKYTNYGISNIISYDKNYIITDKIITFNFGYTLEWNVQNFGFNTVHSQLMNRYSKVRLILEDNEFKIYEIPDEKFFSYCNQFTKDF